MCAYNIMAGNAPELYASLPPESQKLVDNVASAFISSLTNILEHNFKQNKHASGHNVASEYTSSQKLAVSFANRWFTGLINELVQQLSNLDRNMHLNRKFTSTAKPTELLVESRMEGDQGNHTCSVPHIQMDGEGRIQVNYDSEMDSKSEELTAQDFGHLLFTGLQHQMAIMNTLQQFWSVCGSLVLKSVSKFKNMPIDPACSADFTSMNPAGKFEDLVFSKTWYQAVDESLGIVPIRASEDVEGIIGLNELHEISKKLEIEMGDAIEQARVLSRIKSLIDDHN